MATKPTIVVSYYDSNITPFGSLPYVQTVSWSAGRANITDQWSGSTCLITGRSPSTITYPPQIGNKVRVVVTNAGSTNTATFYGYVSDWRVIYGITAAYDTYELTVESGYAKAGRGTATITTTAGASTQAMATSIQTSLGGVDAVDVSTGWGSTTSAQTLTGQVSDSVNRLMATEQGTVIDTGSSFTGYPQSFKTKLGLSGRNDPNLGLPILAFSDVPDSNNSAYSEIQFLSSAQNYGTKVVIQSSGLADQSSGSGDYVQTISTISGSTSEAANLAGYVQAELNLSTAVPYGLTTTGAVSNATPYIMAAADPANIHQGVSIVFRGNTYYCLLEGLSFSANQTDWRVNLYLSSSLQNAFFRIGNTVYGRLDNNKLGF